MKKFLRHFIIDTYALWVISQTADGLVFEGGFNTLVIAGVSVSLVTFLAKPVINLLLLPLNLVTFGIFRFASSAIVIYLVSLIVSDFRVDRFYYSGYQSRWFDIPELSFTGVMAYLSFSLLLSVFMSFIYWLVK